MKLVDLKILIRIDELISQENTGTPKELAEKLNLSKTSFYGYLNYLKYDLGLEV
jgi:hypothetical protein